MLATSIRRLSPLAIPVCALWSAIVPCGCSRVSAAEPAVAAPARDLLIVKFVSEVRTVNGNQQRGVVGRVVQSDELEAALNQCVFGTLPQPMTREQLQAQLSADLDRLDQQFDFTAAGRDRLEHAGRLDIARFWGEYEELVGEFATEDRGVDELNLRIERVNALAKRYAEGLNGGDSLQGKVLRSIVSEKQRFAVDLVNAFADKVENRSTNRLVLYERIDGKLRQVR